jgi:hypothetical protein
MKVFLNGRLGVVVRKCLVWVRDLTLERPQPPHPLVTPTKLSANDRDDELQNSRSITKPHSRNVLSMLRNLTWSSAIGHLMM